MPPGRRFFQTAIIDQKSMICHVAVTRSLVGEPVSPGELRYTTELRLARKATIRLKGAKTRSI